MTDAQITEIQDIFTEIDTLLRERLSAIGAELPYLIVAVAPDGGALVRGTIDPAELKELVKEVEQAAKEAVLRPSDDTEPAH